MGHNRAGVKRKKRLRRNKREMERLGERAGTEAAGGVVEKVKQAASSAAAAVGGALKSVKEKVTGQ